MPSVSFSDSYSVSYWGDITAQVRFTFSESYSSATNQTTLTLTKIEFKKDSTTVVGSIPVFGTLIVDGTTMCTIDNTGSGKMATVSLSGNSWCTADLSNVTKTPAVITHNSDGTKTVTVSMSGGYDSRFCCKYSWYHQYKVDPNTGIPLYRTDQVPFGVPVTKTTTMALTSQGHTLTTAVSPSSYGSVTTGATLAPTAQISLKATPASATTKYTYSFKNWSKTGGTLSSTTTNPTTFTMGTADATVTANFQATPKSYTATFTKGDYISAVSGGGTKDYGTTVTATATLGSATGYTYSFDGWYSGTTKKSSSNPYTFTMPDSNVSYTAKGTRTANTYTVSFNKKGGSGTDVTQTLTYDKSEALKLNTYTKTGYTFKGWDTNSAGTTVVYTDGASVKNLASSGTYTLYAVWQINTWTISYNANGGTGAPSSQTKTYNIDLTLTTTKPTRSSTNPTAFTITYNANGGTVSKSSDSATRTTTYSFNKWNTKSDGSGTNYNSGATYAANAAATLYAQWDSSTTTAAVTLPTATRTGYTFKGWNTNSSATTGTTGSYTATGNVTLYAIWELNSYTLTISQGSGSTIVVKKGSTQLSNGATIYHNDVLTITFSANTGYNLSTHTVNNTTFTSGNTYTVTGATTVASTATKKTYTLSITTSSEGVSTTVNRTSSPIGGGATGNLTNGATLYYNDVLNISYTIGGAYQLLTATVNNTDISSQSLPYTLTATGNVTVSITVKIGAIVYIGDQAYQIYIGNTSTNRYEQYQAYIGNSSAGRYDQY